MKRFIIILIAIITALPMMAQEKKGRFSREEFRAKLEGYITHGKPSTVSQRASSPSVCGHPQTLKIYGLHLSHKEKEKSVAAQEQEDTFAQAKQSSFDKSNSSEKSKTSVPFTAKLCIAILVIIVAVAIIAYIRRRSSGRPTHFGHRLPHS